MKKGTLALIIIFLINILAGCTKANSAVTHNIATKSTSSQQISTSNKTKSQMGNSNSFSTVVKTANAQLTDLKPQLDDTFSDTWVEEGPNSTLIYNFQLSPQMSSEFDIQATHSLILQMLTPYLTQTLATFPDLHSEINYLRPDSSSLASFTVSSAELTTTKD